MTVDLSVPWEWCLAWVDGKHDCISVSGELRLAWVGATCNFASVPCEWCYVWVDDKFDLTSVLWEEWEGVVVSVGR